MFSAVGIPGIHAGEERQTGELCELIRIDAATRTDSAQVFLAEAGLLAEYFSYDALRAVWLCIDAVVDVCCEDLAGFEKR